MTEVTKRALEHGNKMLREVENPNDEFQRNLCIMASQEFEKGEVSILENPPLELMKAMHDAIITADDESFERCSITEEEYWELVLNKYKKYYEDYKEKE